MIEANGPERAKSRSAALLDGNDLSFVIHPVSPKIGENNGNGNPILIFLLLATK